MRELTNFACNCSKTTVRTLAYLLGAGQETFGLHGFVEVGEELCRDLALAKSEMLHDSAGQIHKGILGHASGQPLVRSIQSERFISTVVVIGVHCS